MKNIGRFNLYTSCLVILGTMLVSGCTKEKGDTGNPSHQNLTHTIYSPDASGLIATSVNNESGGIVYYYGDADNADINSIVYKNPSKDSLYYFKLDAQKRMRYIYVKSSDNTIYPTLYSFDYPHPDTTLFSIYDYDWATGANDLLFKASVYRENGSLVNEVLYEKSGNGTLGVCAGMSAVAQSFDNALGVTTSLGAGVAALALGLGPVMATVGAVTYAAIYFSGDLCAAEPTDVIPDDVPSDPEEDENPEPTDTGYDEPYSLTGQWTCTEWLVGGASQFDNPSSPYYPPNAPACSPCPFGTNMSSTGTSGLKWKFLANSSSYTSMEKGTTWVFFYDMNSHCVCNLTSTPYNETNTHTYTLEQDIFSNGEDQYHIQWLGEDQFRLTNLNQNEEMTFER